MSELAALTREVEGLLEQIGKLSRPAQESRHVIAGAMRALDAGAADPQARQAAMRRRDQLARADRILAQAMQSCSQSAKTGQEWLALHAARGGGGGGAGPLPVAGAGGDASPGTGGGGMPVGSSPAAAALASAWASAGGGAGGVTAHGATLANGYAGLAGRLGVDDRTMDAYVFGGVAAGVIGGASPLLKDSTTDLLTALGSAALPPPLGWLAAVGVGIGSKKLIEKAASRGTGTKDAGAYKSSVGQLWKLARERKTDWTRAEWAAETAKVVVPAAVGATLAAAGAPFLVMAAGSAGAGLAGWTLAAAAHKQARHIPKLT